MNTKADMRRYLLESLELTSTWQRLGACVLILLIIFPFIVIYNGLRSGNYLWGVSTVILVICILPYLIFCLWQTLRILRKCEHYIFCKGKLNQPHSSWYRGTMYFTVLLEDPVDSSPLVVDTNAIFYTHGIMQPTIEEYTNSTVTIGYNRETGSVVVIG